MYVLVLFFSFLQKLYYALGELLADEYSDDLVLTSSGLRVYGNVDLGHLLARIVESGVTVTAINTCDTGIEDYYLNAIGGAKNA